MKKQIYVETTVVSYFTARPSRDLLVAEHQEATRELWPKFGHLYETYISALVYEETARGDSEQARARLDAIKPFHMLDIDDEAQTLADKIIGSKDVPPEYPEDALHKAYSCPELCSPEELLEADR